MVIRLICDMRLLLLVFLLIANAGLYANGGGDDPKKKPVSEDSKGRPDLPGTLQIDFGYSLIPSNPLEFEVIGSRSLNFYYMWDFRIGKSKFFFRPGVGVGLDRYKIKNGFSIYNDVDTTYFSAPAAGITMKKSMLITNFADIPLEFRFMTNPDDPGRSLVVSLGGRVGYLFNSHSKEKYVIDDNKRSLKESKDFFVTPLRYSVHARIGVGNFNVFGYYHLNPLFEGDKVLSTKLTNNTITVGISFAGF